MAMIESSQFFKKNSRNSGAVFYKKIVLQIYPPIIGVLKHVFFKEKYEPRGAGGTSRTPNNF